MHHLGISVYPEHSTPERDEAYLAAAEGHGFDRLFTCLLSVERTADQTIDEFGAFCDMAHSHGFEVAVDTNPAVFEHLGARADDLTPFVRMGVNTIRLDGHLGDVGDIAITHNPDGIKVQFNASSNVGLGLLVERGADVRNMCVCHNFFPERFTGLGESRFIEFSRKYRDLGLGSAAFVSSRQPKTFGPWDVFEGLPTCEVDRTRPIDLQARHLLATGLIDDIMIGNCFASEEELAALEAVDTTRITMRLDLDAGVTTTEREVIWGFRHFTRTDASDYLLRSSLPRLSFSERSIPARRPGRDVFHRGDVLVVNDALEHYRGELEVALRDIPDDGTRNLVGTIPDEELFLLGYILPEYAFGFVRQ
jgi:hypothetical protein